MEFKQNTPAQSSYDYDEQNESIIDTYCPVQSSETQLKIKCPAKINLTLEVLEKRPDGFHDIQSIMQSINLFDFLTIRVEPQENFEIILSGTSDEIPYDERNLVHKAVLLFIEYADLPPHKIKIHIEKNIPISAGLAGGSTDAAGTLYGLNKIFDSILSAGELHHLCAKLGSDLNFCLEGGCHLATGRGENLKKLPYCEFPVSLIKPKNIGISAKEAYTKFAQMEKKPNLNNTEEMIEILKLENCNGKLVEKLLNNDLEQAIINDYPELQTIKKAYPNSIMSGSGSTFFVLEEKLAKTLSDEYWTKTGLKSINYGVIKDI